MQRRCCVSCCFLQQLRVCYLTAVTSGSTPDLLRCLQSKQSELALIVSPGRHPLPQEFHVLLLLVGFPLPEYPERTSLQPLLCQRTERNLGTEISSYLRGDNLSPFSVGFRIHLRTRTRYNVEFSTISTLDSVISVSSDYLCINWYGSSLGVYTRVGVPRLQCLGQ